MVVDVVEEIAVLAESAAVADAVCAADVDRLRDRFGTVRLAGVDGGVDVVVPYELEGRTVVPLRLISENLGLDVSWNASTYTVDLSTKVAPTAGGTREGFTVSDKNLGFMAVAANTKSTLLGYTAPSGFVYLQMMVVVKDFSDDPCWVSPETFSVMVGDKKYDYDSTVTFQSK